VVTEERSPYLGGTDGAPPPPPPGGYRGAQRMRVVATGAVVPGAGVPGAGVPRAGVPGPVGAPAGAAPRPRPGGVGVAALCAAITFAAVLLIMWAAGATAGIYGLVVLALQLVVAVLVVTALITPRGRTLGAVALAIALLVNVGTIGAASAVTAGSRGAPGVSPEQDRWAGYPGIRGETEDDILNRPSLEETRDRADEVLAAVRTRLGEEFGVDWVRGRTGGTRAERNGYGGESMLVELTSQVWATSEPVRDHELKLAMMDAIEEVLLEYGFYGLVPLNDPATGFDPDYLERFYGSTDPRTQSEWEWYTDDYPGPMRFYANITDLSHDDGSFRAAREVQIAGSGEPVECLRVWFLVPEMLSEADAEEFSRRMAQF